jgi:DNA-binding CsgD family transcriptional regulator
VRQQIEAVPEVFGREPALVALRGLVAGSLPGRALVLTGHAGFGKTALWEAGLALARGAGRIVQAARASGAEAGTAFAGLIDVCDVVAPDVLGALPSPQRTALEVALLRTEPAAGSAPDPHAIALAYLNVLREMAARQPVLVAVDDLPWLDPVSMSVLTFAARRLRGEPVVFLLSRRPGSSTTLELALAPDRIEVGALDAVAVRRVLGSRLGVFPSRVVLKRIVDISQGNALFALELGRTLRDAGGWSAGQGIPMPDTVEDALGARAAGLAPGVRRLLLGVALNGGLRREELDVLGEREAVDAAFDGDVLVSDGIRVRACHPLLAAAVIKQAPRRELREVHLALAGTVADEELRAWHLALATERPDERLAARVAAAAAKAGVRGARPQAVALAEHALRLTPEDAPAGHERMLALAACLEAAGEARHMTELLTSALDKLPAGTPRAQAWLMLSGGTDVTTLAEFERRLDCALAEEHGVPGVRAQAIAKKAAVTAAVAVRRIAEAEGWVRTALVSGHHVGADVERRLLYSLSWATVLRGRPVDDLCARFTAASSESVHLANSPERVAGQRLVWRGQIEQARAELTRLLRLADDQGEAESYALQRLHLCDLELRVGAWAAAELLLDEWAESVERELLNLPMYERCRALLAAGLGDVGATREWAARAMTRADACGDGWDRLEALRARGTAALLAQQPAEAAADLGTVQAHTKREGVEEPGVFPVAPELVEALVELGDLDRAREVTELLDRQAGQQAHPWGLVTARRCHAVLRLAAGRYIPSAADALAEAAADLTHLGLAFDAARCHLSLGRMQRRRKQWGPARASLKQAVAAFEQLGSPGWAQRARSELARVGGRTPAVPGALTPTEHDVIELAAAGLTNKEIARRLSIAVHTVEVHLSRAYVKLGVRSRSQLAASRGTPRALNP